MRLSRSEVEKLSVEGYIEEHTTFSNSIFLYALKVVEKGTELTASFENNKITMFIPKVLVSGWPDNDIVGFSANMITGKDRLSLLVEKDFICLDETSEDQSDNYQNPNKIC